MIAIATRNQAMLAFVRMSQVRETSIFHTRYASARPVTTRVRTRRRERRMPDQRSATTRDGRRLTYSVAGDGHLLMCHPGGPGFDGLCFEDLAGLTASRTVVSVNPAGTRGSDPWTED